MITSGGTTLGNPVSDSLATCHKVLTPDQVSAESSVIFYLRLIRRIEVLMTFLQWSNIKIQPNDDLWANEGITGQSRWPGWYCMFMLLSAICAESKNMLVWFVLPPFQKNQEKSGSMFSTIGLGTASQATPQGRRHKRAEAGFEFRTDDQTIASPMPWPSGHDIPYSFGSAQKLYSIGVGSPPSPCYRKPAFTSVVCSIHNMFIIQLITKRP